MSKIDPWFLNQIKEIIDNEIKIKNNGLPKNFNDFNQIKSMGFSDKKLSELSNLSEDIVRKKELHLKFYQYSKKLTLVQQNLNLLHHICTQHIREISQ